MDMYSMWVATMGTTTTTLSASGGARNSHHANQEHPVIEITTNANYKRGGR